MRRKGKNLICILCAMSLIAGQVSVANAQEVVNETTAETQDNEWDEEELLSLDDEYKVLRQDELNRELEVKVGDTYVTTVYDDDIGKKTVFYSKEPLSDDNYTEKVTVQDIEKNEYGSTTIVTTENSNGVTVQEYNQYDKETRTVDVSGIVTVNQYEGENLISTISPYKGTKEDELNKISYKYDENGYLIEKKAPVNYKTDGSISYYIEKYAYNSNGDMIVYEKTVNGIDEEELYSKSEYEYDNAGNIIKTAEYDTDGSIISIAQYYYDEDGNRLRQYTGLTDSLTITGLDQVIPGNDTEYSVTKYEYVNGQLVSETDPTGKKETYVYGDDGLLIEKTDKSGNVFKYTYRDGLYKASENIYLNGNSSETPDEKREYIQEVEEDGSYGMLVSIKDENGSINYTYNDSGDVINETDQNGNVITYTYGEDGNISKILVTDSKGVFVGSTGYEYNAYGRLTAIKDADGHNIIAYKYDADNKLTCKEYEDGSKITYDYNTTGWKNGISIENSAGEKAFDISYEYSVNGNILTKTDEVSDKTVSYEYDGMDRLVEEKIEEEKITYEYDAAGNRTAVSDEDTKIENRYDKANRIVETNDTEIRYDANGNMTYDGSKTYTYDARNRLIGVSDEENTIKYGYDINGKLIEREVNGVREEFIWAGELMVARTGDTGSSYYYTDLGNNVVAKEYDNTKEYYMDGTRGDVIAVSDEEGNILRTNEYDGFGDVTTGDDKKGKTEKEEFELGYTGNFYDEASGLVYLDARFYNPETAAFITEDTVTGDQRETITLNRYAYCKQNPVNNTDDSGHWSTADHNTQTDTAMNSRGYGNDSTAQRAMKFGNSCTDKYLHYGTQGHKSEVDIYRGDYDGEMPLPAVRNEKISLNSYNRIKYTGLKGYIDENRIEVKSDTHFVKKARHSAPYHGRGDYYKYAAYMLGIALQYQKGYLTNALTLRNDEIIYQQMNFDLLIKMAGIYEYTYKSGNSISRKEFSYMIMGVALHLVEDDWAHIAVVDMTKSEFNAVKEYILEPELAEKMLYEDKADISFLEFNKLVDKQTLDKQDINIESLFGEAKTATGNKRRQYAAASANRLLGYFKNGTIMYSGSNILEGTDTGTETDIRRLSKLKCSKGSLVVTEMSVDVAGKNKTLYLGRYKCKDCENKKSDSCNLVFYGELGTNKGLGYAQMGEVMSH